MVLITPPGYLQAGTYDAVKDRQYINTVKYYKSTGDNSRARGGLLPDTPAWSAPISIAGLNVTIGPFRTVIGNTFAANGGDYIAVSPNSEVRTVGASSPTTSRIDLIGVQLRDAFYSGAANDVDVVVVAGTPSAGTPAPPPTPAGFQPFYQLTMGVSATAPTATDVRQRTSLLGATNPVFVQQMGQGGSYAGEKRLFPASGIMPAREVYWGDDGQWHGLTNMEFQMGSWVFTNSTLDRAIATWIIPDPGYPYRLVGSGSVWVAMDGLQGWRFAVREGTGAGNTIYWQGGIETRDPDNWFNGANSVPVCGSTQPTLSGARTLTLWAQRKFGAGTQGMVVSNESNVSIQVVPV